MSAAFPEFSRVAHSLPDLRRMIDATGRVLFITAAFASSALYPLWRVKESSPWLAFVCELNPFTHAVELVRFALYGKLNAISLAVVCGCTAVFMVGAILAYDPSRGVIYSSLHADGSGWEMLYCKPGSRHPVDEAMLAEAFGKFKFVATVEEHSVLGGLGGSIAEWLADHADVRARLVRFGTRDEFLHETCEQEHAREYFGLTGAKIAASLKQRRI